MTQKLDIKRYVTRISEDVYVIRQPLGRVCTSICLVVGDHIGVVDTGLGATANTFVYPLVNDIGRRRSDIAMIVNSHCHFDHIGGNREIVETSSAEVAAHELDVRWIEDISLQRREIWERFKEQHPVSSMPEEVTSGTRVTRVLHDGERIELGAREFEVIHFPGHSPGSTCLYDEAGGLLLAGDSIQGGGPRGAGFPMVTDLDGYASALKKIAMRKVVCLVSGHQFLPFGSSPVLEGQEAMVLIAESARTISRCMVAVDGFFESRQTGADLVEVRDFLVDKFAEGQKAIGSLFTTDAILAKLFEQGRIVRDEESGTWRSK